MHGIRRAAEEADPARLADYPPMGESTAKILANRTATPPRSIDSHDTDGAPEGREGRVHALVTRLRTPRRPRLWFEILLIAVSYWVYSLVRNAVPEQQEG